MELHSQATRLEKFRFAGRQAYGMGERRSSANLHAISFMFITSQEELQTSRARMSFLSDLCHWSESRRSKTNPRAPEFKHKYLWIDGCHYSPSWVEDRLRPEETEELCAIKRMLQAQEDEEGQY